MSRIGKKVITIASGVKVELSGGRVCVEGPKGKLAREIPSGITVQVGDGRVEVLRSSDEKSNRALHGLVRSMIQNMVHGVVSEFSKNLQIEGVGFKAQLNGKILQLALGFSHPINYHIPEGITIEVPKPTQMSVKGIDRALVGQVAADLRRFFEPEPYKGKGIRFVNEQVRKKKGKAVQ